VEKGERRIALAGRAVFTDERAQPGISAAGERLLRESADILKDTAGGITIQVTASDKDRSAVLADAAADRLSRLLMIPRSSLTVQSVQGRPARLEMRVGAVVTR
jgi:hypothetical protein